MGTLKCGILHSVVFDDVVVLTPFGPLSFTGVCDLYHTVMGFMPIPGDVKSVFFCSSTVYFAILYSNKVTGTVMTFRGYLQIVYVDGAGKSDFSVINNKISSLRAPVCSTYTDNYLSNSFLRPTVIPYCSVTSSTIIHAICTESIQVFTLSSATVVAVTGLAVSSTYCPASSSVCSLPR